MENDFIGSLRKVKDAGYDSVEFAGYGGYSASDLKRELDQIGLDPYSSHVGWQQLQDNLDEVVSYSKALGLKWVVCPGYPISSAEDCRNLALLLNRAAKALQPEGIQVAYHNHSHEFVQFDGKFALDIMLEHADPGMVFAELDLCWVQYANVDPVAYLDQLGNQAGPIHCKDINENYAELAGEDINVEVGNGMIDFAKIFEVARINQILERGLIVEQEAFTRDPFKSIKISCQNIRQTLADMGIES